MRKQFPLFLTASLITAQLVTPPKVQAQTPAAVPLAVLDFQAKGGVSNDEASIISDRVRTQIFRSGRFQVMERANMLSILKEQGFQQTQTGCDSTTCSVEAGKLLAVRQIMTGSVSKLGAIYTLSFRIVDVERGEILHDEYRDCRCSLEEVLTRLSGEMVTELTAQNTPPAPQASPSALPAPQLAKDPELAQRIASLPLADRQAFFKENEHYPLLASTLNLTLPFGYVYLNDWSKFWTVGGIEAGLILAPFLGYALGGSTGVNLIGPLAAIGLAATWGYGLVDGFLVANTKNQELRQLLQLTQASEEPFLRSASAPIAWPVLKFQARF